MNKRKFDIGDWVEVKRGKFKGIAGKIRGIESEYVWRNDYEMMSKRAIYRLSDVIVKHSTVKIIDELNKFLFDIEKVKNGISFRSYELDFYVKDEEPQDTLGLIEKYLVFKKNKIGQWVEKGTPSFVLSPFKNDDYGYASRNALKEYVRVIERKNQVLAKEIREWVNVICNELEPK
jgi:hypothetical protein